jgi:hypothetical protein
MTEESFYRPDEFSREAHTLPAGLYNRARLLVMRSESGHVFVPIRSMQYLAVLDMEEFIFVDGAGSRIIELSWQRFRPGSRNTLDDPVPYEIVYYSQGAIQTMKRLQSDFSKALDALTSKQEPLQQQAKVIPLKRD